MSYEITPSTPRFARLERERGEFERESREEFKGKNTLTLEVPMSKPKNVEQTRLTTAERMSRDLIRWQATHLARALWQLANNDGRIEWQSATLNTVDAVSSDGTRTTGSTPHPQYLEIYVPEVLQNGWEEHNLMLMRQDWIAAMTGMTELERTEWTRFLFTERPSDLYRLKVPYVWRNEVPLELCECACRMVAYCKIIYFLPEFVLDSV